MNDNQRKVLEDLVRTIFEVEEILDNEVRPSITRAAKHEATRMLIKSKDTLIAILEDDEERNAVYKLQ